jgi:hypothetical protein
MAEGVERDPQVETILAGKKAQLGIGGLEFTGSLIRQLAMSSGFDLGRGLLIGLSRLMLDLPKADLSGDRRKPGTAFGNQQEPISIGGSSRSGCPSGEIARPIGSGEKGTSFDDLVGAGEDRLRHGEAERLGGL